ncbi:hypothetical protein COCON_G00055370 [Conger conger]|uniref:tRNA wybutosine-synthesizing protein 4 n=1 Tax=Conger conger TaxID=82655 RepID=A0A9Q1I628_CONCO|nr:hypothetical protein COCON_G00055370 [Conger conger]
MQACNRKKKHGKDTAVQGTNDSSVVSKVSAAAQGYFRDDFLKSFVCKVSRRAPLINRGYYVRWCAVDHCVKRFLRVTEGCPRRQVLSLGAGFDSLYFRLQAEGAVERVVVYEVDFPDVARRKAALIKGSNHLKDALKDWSPDSPSPNGPVCVSSARYSLLGVDVREERGVEEALSQAGVQWGAPTLLLSDAVIGWAARLFPQSLFVMYEQIRPGDPFGRVMQEHFLKLNSALHAIGHYPDTAAQRRRFLDRGWERCSCLDMNQFYLDLVSEKERHRVENLEPFDEFEEWHQKCSHYFILTASRGPLTSQALVSPLSVCSSLRAAGTEPPCPPRDALSEAPEGPGWEGLGMGSAPLGPGAVLLSGGAGRGGRGDGARLLIRGPRGWRCVCMGPQTGVRMYHTLTAIPDWGVVVFGGRTSPLHPIGSVLRMTYDLSSLPDPSGPDGPARDWLSVEELVCTGNEPLPRWRHTATLLRYSGQNFLFVFGGRTEAEPVLGDAHFLCVEDQHWTEVPVDGEPPGARHSHSACGYAGGAVIFGGLGGGGAALGDAVVLRPAETGFCWARLRVHPAPAPRYSHSAHVIGHKLVLVGGVWLQAEGVPGVAVIDLTTGGSVEYSLDTSGVPWPLMLHSFRSEPLDEEGAVIAVTGGGGTASLSGRI